MPTSPHSPVASRNVPPLLIYLVAASSSCTIIACSRRVYFPAPDINARLPFVAGVSYGAGGSGAGGGTRVVRRIDDVGPSDTSTARLVAVRDDEDDVLALSQPTANSVPPSFPVSCYNRSFLYSDAHTVITNVISPSFIRSSFSSDSMRTVVYTAICSVPSVRHIRASKLHFR